jgi:hypothetical protein
MVYIGGSSVGLGKAQQSQLNERQDKDPDEKRDRNRGCITDIQQLDALVIDVRHDDIRTEERSAARCQHPHHVEDFEGGDDRHHEHEEHRGSELRERYVDETSPCVRPVHLCSFIEMLRDTLEAGQEDDHVEPYVLPDAHGDHTPDSPGGVVEPVIRRKSGFQHPVREQSDVRIEEIAPDQRHDGERCQDGQKKSAAK